ncbi:GLUG motif-containing protein [Priestia aryabhattai]
MQNETSKNDINATENNKQISKGKTYNKECKSGENQTTVSEDGLLTNVVNCSKINENNSQKKENAISENYLTPLTSKALIQTPFFPKTYEVNGDRTITIGNVIPKQKEDVSKVPSDNEKVPDKQVVSPPNDDNDIPMPDVPNEEPEIVSPSPEVPTNPGDTEVTPENPSDSDDPVVAPEEPEEPEDPEEPVEVPDGSKSHPYKISTCLELQDIASDLQASYVLNNDIDCSDTLNWGDGIGFEPIATEEKEFQGSLDGRGFKVSNLQINRSEEDNVGVFSATKNASIKNLSFTNISVKGYDYTAGLISYIGDNTNLYNVKVSGSVEGANLEGAVGGIVATNYGILDNVESNMEIKGGWDVGGLVAQNYNLIKNSKSYSKVTSINPDTYNIGGFVGYNYETGVIENSLSTSTVSGVGESMGGFAGANGGLISLSYSNSTVSGNTHLGAFVGENHSNIENSYSVGEVRAAFGECQGGFAGGIYSNNGEITSIKNSYSKALVKGINGVGAFAGCAYDTELENVYGTGEVEGNIYFGGLVGYADSNVLTRDSYWDRETTKQPYSGSGEEKTTSDMKQKATYLNWNFNSIWNINSNINNGYPYLYGVPTN